MTISIARPHGTDIVCGDLRAAVQPADVWDINSTRTPRRHAGNVRTLADSDRKESLTQSRASIRGVEAFENIEARREKRGAIAMGVLLGIGLFIGSALGGAFSGGEIDPADTAVDGAVASMSAR